MKFQHNGIEIRVGKKEIERLVLASLAGAMRPNEIPPIGEYWDGQGGVNHGLMLGTDGKPFWLLAATHEIKSAWDKQERMIDGEFSSIDGVHNTELMLSANISLAKEVRTYSADGHADFYLGSSKEMHLARANQDRHWKPKWYWTSTQYSAHDAWVQWFGDGDAGPNGKGSMGLARPFRRLSFSNPVIQ